MSSYSFGYLPELTDVRDFTVKDVRNELPLSLNKSLQTENPELAKLVDNREWCTTTENQGSQGSCTAHSAVAMFEYMEKKANQNYIDGSRAFVYFNTRLHAGFSIRADTGSYIRSTIKAIVMDGIAEESKFPYNQKVWSTKPSEEIYRNALNFKVTQYVRLDDGSGGLINRMKSFVNNGFPINFGFSVYECWNDITSSVPVLPWPTKSEKILGGHAVIIVGFDDEAPSRNKRNNNVTKGAFLCQNSYGPNWGQKGFFYIPYEYFTKGLAMDVWTINSIEWVNTKAFD